MRANKRLLRVSLFCLAALLAAALFRIYHLERHKGHRFILITIDALRPDHLGCYGYTRDTSPHLDSFARESALFTQAISQGSWTLPSITSLLTSTNPNRTHSQYTWAYRLPRSFLTLPQALQKLGYHTGAFFNIFQTRIRDTGFNRGFDTFEETPGLDAQQTTQWAIRWLDNNKRGNSFLWLHYGDTHMPYNAPASYKGMFTAVNRSQQDMPDIPLGQDVRKWDSGWETIPNNLEKYGTQDPDFLVAQYDRSIRYTDDQIGILLEYLKKTGLYGTTTIIITADHGESLGEHGWFFKHGVITYDTVVKVPLLIRYPGIKMLRISQQVRLIDIMPTILEMVKAPYHGGRMEGTSLLPSLTAGKPFPPSDAFSESGSSRSLRSGGWKLIHTHNTNIPEYTEYELYDLTADPQESHNLSGEEKERFLSLKRRLDEYERDGMIPMKLDPITLSPEEVYRLRSLGYAQ